MNTRHGISGLVTAMALACGISQHAAAAEIYVSFTGTVAPVLYTDINTGVVTTTPPHSGFYYSSNEIGDELRLFGGGLRHIR